MDVTQSPFFSRSYGGFTSEQREFYLGELGEPSGKKILDPTAGQAHCLSQLAGHGAHVYLGDINPSLLLLAFLRTPQVLSCHDELERWMEKGLAQLSKRRLPDNQKMRSDDWLAPNARLDLGHYAAVCGINQLPSPYRFDTSFWQAPMEQVFATALAILAARRITCFRTSRNLTWLRPGGLAREKRIIAALRDAFAAWKAFAVDTLESWKGNRRGRLQLVRMDAPRGRLGRCRNVDAIITSPPYANRLDYSRMWGPETHVLDCLFGDERITEIKSEQMGSIVVRGKGHVVEDIPSLPECVQVPLRQIHEDPSPDSSNYYFPFFMDYAKGLVAALQHITRRLAAGGVIVVFVRDTVRKDVMFPTGELVGTTLLECGCTKINVEKKVVKRHIGFVRKAQARGLYGPAQLEWWLAYRKD